MRSARRIVPVALVAALLMVALVTLGLSQRAEAQPFATGIGTVEVLPVGAGVGGVKSADLAGGGVTVGTVTGINAIFSNQEPLLGGPALTVGVCVRFSFDPAEVPFPFDGGTGNTIFNLILVAVDDDDFDDDGIDNDDDVDDDNDGINDDVDDDDDNDGINDDVDDDDDNDGKNDDVDDLDDDDFDNDGIPNCADLDDDNDGIHDDDDDDDDNDGIKDDDDDDDDNDGVKDDDDDATTTGS